MNELKKASGGRLMLTFTLISALLLGTAAVAQTTVTFDDLSTPGQDGTAGLGSIPNPYAGLNWTCLGNPTCQVVNGPTYGANPSGYQGAVVSPSNVLSTGYGAGQTASQLTIAPAAGGTFTFNSAYFTGAWLDGVTVSVAGMNGANEVDSAKFVLGAAGIPTLYSFNWSNLTSVLITPSGGTPHAGYAYSLLILAIDNLTYNGPVASQQYMVTPIPAPTQYPSGSMVGYGINGSGAVVGAIEGSTGVPAQAFLYGKGVTQILTPLAQPEDEALAYAINQSGTIVGQSSNSGAQPNAVAWMSENGSVTGPTDLKSLYFANFFWSSSANAVNSADVAVGTSLGAAGGSISTDTHAALFSGGAVSDLGTLGGNDSEALAINDAGQIVGDSQTATMGQSIAFLYQSGSMQNLGTLGGLNSSAAGINSAGVIVGWSGTTSAPSGEEAVSWVDGAWTDLGTLGGPDSWANAINTSGEIVGASQTPGHAQHAFIYADGTMSDLNSQISSAEAKRYTLVDAVAINDNGQVVAQGYLSSDKDETTQSFLLTPLSPSISAVVTGTLGMNDWYITPTTVSWIVTGHPAPTKSGCGKVSVPNSTGTTYTCSATNISGSAQQSVTVKRDSIPPVVTVRSPANNASYTLHERVLASFSCTDGISGVASCVGTAANGSRISTSVSGPQAFMVVGTDSAGNVTTRTVTYTVN